MLQTQSLDVTTTSSNTTGTGSSAASRGRPLEPESFPSDASASDPAEPTSSPLAKKARTAIPTLRTRSPAKTTAPAVDEASLSTPSDSMPTSAPSVTREDADHSYYLGLITRPRLIAKGQSSTVAATRIHPLGDFGTKSLYPIDPSHPIVSAWRSGLDAHLATASLFMPVRIGPNGQDARSVIWIGAADDTPTDPAALTIERIESLLHDHAITAVWPSEASPQHRPPVLWREL